MTEVWDPGLQPERTALSWRRLAMVFLGVALVLPRLVWRAVGAWSLPAAGLVAALAVVVFTAGERRYGRTHRSLVSSSALPDARLLALTAGAALVLGLVGLATVLQHGLG